MRLLALGAFSVSCGAALVGQTAAKTGPSVGEKVPEFEVVDQNGASHSLHSLMGPKGMMLVFFRSADW